MSAFSTAKRNGLSRPNIIQMAQLQQSQLHSQSVTHHSKISIPANHYCAPPLQLYKIYLILHLLTKPTTTAFWSCQQLLLPPKNCMEARPLKMVTTTRARQSPLCEVLALNVSWSKLSLICPTPSCKHGSRNLWQWHLVQLTVTRPVGHSQQRPHHQSGRRRM